MSPRRPGWAVRARRRVFGLFRARANDTLAAGDPSGPSGFRFSATSEERLATCHPVLQLVMRRAIATSPIDFKVLEGHRGKEAQEAAVARGASRVHWPHGRHNSTPSLAVDIAPVIDGDVSWAWPDFYALAPHIKAAWASLTPAERQGFRLEWGWDLWRWDGPHWQLTPA